MSKFKTFIEIVELSSKYKYLMDNEFDLDLILRIDGEDHRFHTAMVELDRFTLVSETIEAYYQLKYSSGIPHPTLVSWSK